jgi:hypothetical protein
MKFQILLYVLGRKIKSKVKKDPEFKKKISDKNCTVQIKTADNSKGRYFSFNNGEVTTCSGVSSNADVSLVWQDAKIAFDVLSSGSQEKSMKALQDGTLKLEGDGAIALWFTDVAKQSR